MSIYQDIILDHYHFPRNRQRLVAPTSFISVSNPLCGDTLTVELEMKDGTVEHVCFEASGCAISQASASLLSEYIVGKSKDTLLKIDKEFILKILGIELSPNRIKCALLALEGLHKAVTRVTDHS